MMKNKKKNGRVFLATGGSGGHVFPALALGKHMHQKGWDVRYSVDSRVSHMIENQADPGSLYVIAAKSPSVKAGKLIALMLLCWGCAQAIWIMTVKRPHLVIGFGSYASVPPLMAAVLLRIPIFLHEQNAVSGRANRLFARFARAIAVSYPKPKGLTQTDKLVLTGTPIRDGFRGKKQTYTPPHDTLCILIFGGSQGAKTFSRVLPKVFAQMPKHIRTRLHILQQAENESCALISEHYQSHGIKAEVTPFIKDMPKQLSKCHLVICRSGASTVSELVAMGRPAVLVPYPHTLDGDQIANAAHLVAVGGAWVIREELFTPERVKKHLIKILSAPDDLEKRALAAGSIAPQDSLKKIEKLIQQKIGL